LENNKNVTKRKKRDQNKKRKRTFFASMTKVTVKLLLILE